MVRPVRAGRHAAGDRREARGGRAQGDGGPAGAPQVRRARAGADAAGQRTVPRADRGGGPRLRGHPEPGETGGGVSAGLQ